MNTALRFLLAAIVLYAGLPAPNVRAEVIFSEDFESETLGERWEKYRDDPVRADFETQQKFVHSGKKSYRLTRPANLGESKTSDGRVVSESDSWIRTWILPGYDTVYIRWYVMFSEDIKEGGGHWCQFWGTRADNARNVLGGAGRRPDGTDRFIANVEPRPIDGQPPMGSIAFYTYWPDMKQSRDGKYWGNYFHPEEPISIGLGRWYCFEMMVKCNEPGKKDGEQALWIDGKEIMRTKDMRWRDIDALKVTMLMFGNYSSRARYERTYWMDDIVVSTEYVGPMAE